MPPHRIHGLESERNRNKRRDKMAQKKRTGMRVDDSAKKLAGIRAARYGKFIFMTNELLKEDPYNGRSRED